MNATYELLTRAREMYAKAPSHAPYGEGCENWKYCPMLAIELQNTELTARGIFPHRNDAMTALARAAGLADEDIRRRIIVWNSETSTEEVVAAFDRAITEVGVGDE